MDILVTLNSNYLKPLKIMLKSLFINHPDESFTIYLMHSSISEAELADLAGYVSAEGNRLEVIGVDPDMFRDAPVVKHYSKEMYYRILAYRFLPDKLDKILYLDPDLLVINSIRELYDTDLTGYLYAAAYHDRVAVTEINKIRLMPYEIQAYYNTGVMLMNLALQREMIREQDIFDFVEENKFKLILPDQDIINALYSRYIKQIDEIRYNYDPRFYHYYKILSNGKYDMDYIINHTSIIHFCGKRKPWHKKYRGLFYSLYKHYEKLACLQEEARKAEVQPQV